MVSNVKIDNPNLFRHHVLIFLVLLNFIAATDAECGGTLTSTRGVLQTPNYPNEFQAPIFCRWIIDATDIATPNTSIIVYLTQLFVTEGLTFDEYEAYDVSYNILGKRIHTVLESNVSKQKWVQTQQNVLVVTFELKSIENSHLRILDYFLDVYGFNITYEITKEPVRADACTMSECGFTGTCYDDFEQFYCECFPGYTGTSCSEGARSMCIVEGEPYCQNRGICRQVGSNYVKCDCRGGYIGKQCEKRINANIDDCSSGAYPASCGCSKQHNISADGADFTATLKFMQGPSLTKDELLRLVKNQISSAKIPIPSMNQMLIKELHYNDWGTEVAIHFRAIKKDKKRLETMIQRWITSGRVGNFTLIENKSSLRNETYPLVKSIYTNQIGPVREGDSFLLSCVTLSYPNTNYRWYKDGYPLIITKETSNKWFRISIDPDDIHQITNLLGVERVSHLDQGSFVCEAEESEIYGCSSKHVEVRRPPSIRIEPMSLSLQKGENFSIKCFASSQDNGEYKYTYSWTKNKELLPIKTELEKYEILYPSGSILQVSKIEKTATFSCLVQDDVSSTEVGVQVDVFDRSLIHTCRKEKHMNIVWPETSPGTQTLQECPRGFTGAVKRCCVQHDVDRSMWQRADFSECIADSLMKSAEYFQEIVLGYDHKSELEILQHIQAYLKDKRNLLAGEGSKILELLKSLVASIVADKKFGPINNVTQIVFDVIARILVHSNALITQKQVVMLQEAMRKQMYFADMLLQKNSIYHQSMISLDITVIRTWMKNVLVVVPPYDGSYSYPSWYAFDLEFNPNAVPNRSFVVACVVYRSLAMYLPSRSAFRLSDGMEMEYEIVSNIAAVWLLDSRYYVDEFKIPLKMEFLHTPVNRTGKKWHVACAWATYATYGYNWDIKGCTTVPVNATMTKCSCVKLGTYAVLATARPLSYAVDEPKPNQAWVVLGCSMCAIFGTILYIIWLSHWVIIQSCITFLKMQYCFVLACANTIFLTALVIDLPEDRYSYITTTLEIFLLIALSSHVSKCLLVFTEFAQSTQGPNLNKTIVAISTGVPVITVFASHLTHRTMGKRELSWWLINGSVSFNIFITAFLMIIILYNVMFLIVIERFSQFIGNEFKESSLLTERKKLMRRSFYIFWTTVIMICSSVMFINVRDSALWCYTFGASNIVLTLTLLACYIIFPESAVLQVFFDECAAMENEYSSSVVSSERSPPPPKRLSLFERTPSSSRNRPAADQKPALQLSDLQNIPTQARNDALLKQSKEDVQEYMYSPDVVATRVHVELDLVAPMVHEKTEEAPLIFCNIAVNSSCESFKPFGPLTVEDQVTLENIENASKLHERLQPEGLETLIEEDEMKCDDNQDQQSVKIVVQDSLDGMLDKISHDLDYLLNRKGSYPALTEGKDEMVRPEATEPTVCNF